MKPILLVSGDFVSTGGMDRANYALAAYLARQGHPVHLVAFRVADDLLQHPNVIWHRVTKVARSYFLSGPLLDQVGRFWARRVARQGGRVVVNGGNCSFGDVNWVHYIHAAFPPSGHGRLLQRLKQNLLYCAGRRAERRALGMARLVIANSHVTRHALLRQFGLNAAQVHTVYLGTDPTQFHAPEKAERAELSARLGWPLDRPKVAFVGAMGDQRKGFDTLYAAWQRLCRCPDWDADLVVIGQGRELPPWKERTLRDGLANRIAFLGFRDDVPALLRASDAVVSPTRYEPYGLNVHEALCCGLPAFVSAGAGIAERYPPNLQELVIPDPEDAEDLAARLLRWRQELSEWPARIVHFSAALRERTWDRMAADIVQLVNEHP